MSKVYAAQPRFLTFAEAEILERSLKERLHILEQEGADGSPEEVHIHQMLRDLVYFTTADTLKDFKAYLRSQGWVAGGLWADGAYEIFWAAEGEQTWESGERISFLLPPSMTVPHAEETVRRALFFLAFLEDPEEVSAYDILQRVRAHAGT